MIPTMLSTQDAEAMIRELMPQMATITLDIEDCGDEVIAEDIYADRHLPPFDRVAMDGIAVCYQGIQGERLHIEGLQKAGEPRKKLRNSNSCLEVMTGASLPEGCDTVIPYEHIKIEDGLANLSEQSITCSQNIHPCGSDQKLGELVLPKGTLLRSAELAIAAAVGQAKLVIRRRPSIALISTGDELVDVTVKPAPHQIRRSNEYALASSLRAFGFTKFGKFHCPDDHNLMRQQIARYLKDHDVLIFTGGVSAGKFDLLPQVLAELGVEGVFHKIRQRPGKPMFFGMHQGQRPIFGLPGNPVSALVTFHRYVLPALQQSIGQQVRKPMYVRLQSDLHFDKPMTLFRQARLHWDNNATLWAEPLASNGSGDFISLRDSDGFIELAAEQSQFLQDSLVPFWSWR
ncbi:MAG: molybdopterin molybdotransferase MoeA [Oligoflexus sp.]